MTYIYMALRLKPDFPSAQMLLGEIWEDRRSWEKAMSIYAAVDTGSAQRRNAAIRMAWARHKMGDEAAAMAALEKLAAEDESDIEPLVVLADIYRDQKNGRRRQKIMAAPLTVCRSSCPITGRCFMPAALPMNNRSNGRRRSWICSRRWNCAPIIPK